MSRWTAVESKPSDGSERLLRGEKLMISLDHKLRIIDDFLVTIPNVAIRVKFAGSDKYRNFEAVNVTNDTFCDTVA